MTETTRRDYDAFRKVLPDLLLDREDHDRYALMHFGEMTGLYADFESALAAGYERFELDPFLVKHVVANPKLRYFTRALRCPT